MPNGKIGARKGAAKARSHSQKASGFSKACFFCKESIKLRMTIGAIVFILLIAGVVQLLILGVGPGLTSSVTSIVQTTTEDFATGIAGSGIDLISEPGSIQLGKQKLAYVSKSLFEKGITWNPLAHTDIADVSETQVIAGKTYVMDEKNGSLLANGTYNSIWYDQNTDYLYAGNSNGLYVVATQGTADPLDDSLVNLYDASNAGLELSAYSFVDCITTDPSSRYVFVCNGGKLKVIDSITNLVSMTYSATSTPSVTGGIFKAYVDSSSGLLYAISSDGVFAIDMNGEPGTNDVLLATYSNSSIINVQYPRNVAVDSINSLLYVEGLGIYVIDLGADGVPGGTDDVLAHNYGANDFQMALTENGLASTDGLSLKIYDFNNTPANFEDDTVKEYNANSTPKLDSWVNSIAYSNNQNLVYVSTNDGVNVYNPSSDSFVGRYTGASVPHIANGGQYKMVIDEQSNILYSTNYISGISVLSIDVFNKQMEYRSQPEKFTYFPDALSVLSTLNAGDNISLFARTGSEEVYYFNDFNDSVGSAGGIIGGGRWESDTVPGEDGILVLTNPNSSIVDAVMNTQKDWELFPSGSIIKVRARLTTASDNVLVTLFHNDTIEEGISIANPDGWFVLTLQISNLWTPNGIDSGTGNFKVGLETNWPDEDYNPSDKLEIDWVSVTMPDSSTAWGEWAPLGSNGEIVFDSQPLLQYKVLIENADISDTPSINSAVFTKSSFSTDGVFTSSVIDANEPVDWQNLVATTVEPVGTKINFYTRTGNVAIPDDSWSQWKSAENGLRSPDGRYIQWKSELITEDALATPLIEDVTVKYYTPSTEVGGVQIIDFANNSDYILEDARVTSSPPAMKFESKGAGNGVLLDSTDNPVNLSASKIAPGCSIRIGSSDFVISTVYNSITNQLEPGYAWISVTKEGLMPDEVDAAVPDGISNVSYIHCTETNGEIQLGSANYAVEEIKLEGALVNSQEQTIKDPISGNIVAFYANSAYIIDSSTGVVSGSNEICEAGVSEFSDALYDIGNGEVWYACYGGTSVKLARISPISGSVTLGPIDTLSNKCNLSYLNAPQFNTKAVIVSGCDNTGVLRAYDYATGTLIGVKDVGETIGDMVYDFGRQGSWVLPSDLNYLSLTDLEQRDLKQFTLPEPAQGGNYNEILYDEQTDSLWARSDFEVVNISAQNGEVLGMAVFPNTVVSMSVFEDRNSLAVSTDKGDGVYLVDRQSYEVQSLPYSTGGCGYGISAVNDELWVLGCSPASAYRFVPNGVPQNNLYTTMTSSASQVGGSGTDGIESFVISGNVDSGNTYYSVSFDERNSFKVFTSGAWRTIASNKASDHGGTDGVWYLRDNANSWIASFSNNATTSVSDAVLQGANNQMSGSMLSAVTSAQWDSVGGLTAGANVNLAVTLGATSATDNPSVSNIEVDFVEREIVGPVGIPDVAYYTTASANKVIDVMTNDYHPNNLGFVLESFDDSSLSIGTITRDENGTIGDYSDDKIVYFSTTGTASVDEFFTYTIRDSAGDAVSVRVDVIHAAKSRQIGAGNDFTIRHTDPPGWYYFGTTDSGAYLNFNVYKIASSQLTDIVIKDVSIASDPMIEFSYVYLGEPAKRPSVPYAVGVSLGQNTATGVVINRIYTAPAAIYGMPADSSWKYKANTTDWEDDNVTELEGGIVMSSTEVDTQHVVFDANGNIAGFNLRRRSTGSYMQTEPIVHFGPITSVKHRSGSLVGGTGETTEAAFDMGNVGGQYLTPLRTNTCTLYGSNSTYTIKLSIEPDGRGSNKLGAFYDPTTADCQSLTDKQHLVYMLGQNLNNINRIGNTAGYLYRMTGLSANDAKLSVTAPFRIDQAQKFYVEKSASDYYLKPDSSSPPALNMVPDQGTALGSIDLAFKKGGSPLTNANGYIDLTFSPSLVLDSGSSNAYFASKYSTDNSNNYSVGIGKLWASSASLNGGTSTNTTSLKREPTDPSRVQILNVSNDAKAGFIQGGVDLDPSANPANDLIISKANAGYSEFAIAQLPPVPPEMWVYRTESTNSVTPNIYTVLDGDSADTVTIVRPGIDQFNHTLGSSYITNAKLLNPIASTMNIVASAVSGIETKAANWLIGGGSDLKVDFVNNTNSEVYSRVIKDDVFDNDIEGACRQVEALKVVNDGTLTNKVKIDVEIPGDATGKTYKLYKSENSGSKTLVGSESVSGGKAVFADVSKSLTGAVNDVTDLFVCTDSTAPRATDESFAVLKNSVTQIQVLTNDSSPAGGTLTVASVSEGPYNGTAAIVGDVVEYRPNPGFGGVDYFRYVVSGAGGTDEGTVTMSVAKLCNENPGNYDGCNQALGGLVTHNIAGTTGGQQVRAGARVVAYNRLSECYTSNQNNPVSVILQCPFVNDVLTGEDGTFTLPLPVGKYMVYVVDADPVFSSNGYPRHAVDIAPGELGQARFAYLQTTDNKKLPTKTTKFTGSALFVLEPQYVEFSETTFVPFMFEAVDSEWSGDVCLEVPQGYEPVDGNNCQQFIAAGESSVIEFKIIETGSKPGTIKTKFKVKHNGKEQKADSSIRAKTTPEYAKKKGVKIDENGFVKEGGSAASISAAGAAAGLFTLLFARRPLLMVVGSIKKISANDKKNQTMD
ncbi:MAG: Type I secretion target repeat protein [uncultured bacterium]|nr:MAG: Type I secretion target repeat protein [uncultured bacterium]HBD05331.1 hypothetical protein [Candidatus Uhrbacteria bacterium]